MAKEDARAPLLSFNFKTVAELTLKETVYKYAEIALAISVGICVVWVCVGNCIYQKQLEKFDQSMPKQKVYRKWLKEYVRIGNAWDQDAVLAFSTVHMKTMSDFGFDDEPLPAQKFDDSGIKIHDQTADISKATINSE